MDRPKYNNHQQLLGNLLTKLNTHTSYQLNTQETADKTLNKDQ